MSPTAAVSKILVKTISFIPKRLNKNTSGILNDEAKREKKTPPSHIDRAQITVLVGVGISSTINFTKGVLVALSKSFKCIAAILQFPRNTGGIWENCQKKVESLPAILQLWREQLSSSWLESALEKSSPNY
ncbi:uncharacterized protein LOC132700943 [Cylas formicarius]|uniref:uncharacterized protein LOC132700943 n=1 Tax=Cylas formicarius TaxID=197179 RepID=UPI00295840AE|nr:uncharacterized protein LOC132700943 [Cylas formicarius]